MSKIANKEFDKKWYDLIVGSSLYAYLFHYLFLSIVTRMCVLQLDMGFVANVIVNFILTELFILVTWILLKGLVNLICKKKKKQSNDI